MDPVAHTLFGAVLAETGLRRASRYATAVLLIGVNLPDVDGVASFWGTDVSLWFRRGWSHGVLALALWPLLLTGLVLLYHRLWGRRRSQAPPPRAWVLLGLATLAVWSHPLLDWLNTYGVRLLMPFDGRWFYGDTLFIIDPWVWLLAAAAVVLARAEGPAAISGWVLLAVLSSALVLGTALVALPVKVLWIAGIALIVGLRLRRPAPGGVRTVARFSVAALLIYGCTAYGLARLAEQGVWGESPEALEVQANPVPGQPGAHRLVAVYPDHYRVTRADGETYRVPRREPDAIVQAALDSPEIRGFANWMRYPYWEVERVDEGWWVRIRDLRYIEPGGGGPDIGYAQALVSRERFPARHVATSDEEANDVEEQ